MSELRLPSFLPSSLTHTHTSSPAKVEDELTDIQSHSYAANKFSQSTETIDVSSVAEHCHMGRVQPDSLWAKLGQLSAETSVEVSAVSFLKDACVGRSRKRGGSCWFAGGQFLKTKIRWQVHFERAV